MIIDDASIYIGKTIKNIDIGWATVKIEFTDDTLLSVYSDGLEVEDN